MGYVSGKRDVKTGIKEKLEILTGTMTKLNKGKEVFLGTLLKICDYFDCNIGDICNVVRVK